VVRLLDTNSTDGGDEMVKKMEKALLIIDKNRYAISKQKT